MASEVQVSFDSEKFEQLLTRYFKVKELMLQSEDIDAEAKANIQIYNELRSCLDHLMVVFLAQHSELLDDNLFDEASKKMLLELKSPEQVARKNVSSAIKHLDRAFFDCCDFIYLSYRNLINGVLQRCTDEDIQSVLPTYFTKMKPELDRAGELTKSFRMARTQSEEKRNSVIEEFTNMMERVAAYAKQIRQAEPQLHDLAARRREADAMRFESRPSNVVALVVGFLFGAGLIVFLSDGRGGEIVEGIRGAFASLASCLLG